MNTPRVKTPTKVTICGGGLAGSLLAVYLGQRGFEVGVYERRGDIREAEIVRGRSINLAISTRGLSALRGVGLEDKALEIAVPMAGRQMHAVDGTQTFQAYGTDPSQVINSISRADLNCMLLDEAEKLDNVTLHFNKRCLDVDLDTGEAEFFCEETKEELTIEADFVVGADGAFSAVRQVMQKRSGFDYSQDYLDYGYKELHIPPAEDGGFRIEKNALHIWPRQSHMMIALPNEDGSFTCTLFWPMTGQHGFDRLKNEAEVLDYFEKNFGDSVPHIPNLVDDYLNNQASSLVTIRCAPWNVADKVVLVGDACHAIVPFYGQGMNAAFEDCRILAECIDRRLNAGGDVDWRATFDEYSKLRKENGDAIAQLALDNFVEMRDHVASTWFLVKKYLGKLAHKVAPNAFVPLYTMVSFTNLPYAEARRRAAAQVRWVKRGLAAAGVLIVGAIAIVATR